MPLEGNMSWNLKSNNGTSNWRYSWLVETTMCELERVTLRKAKSLYQWFKGTLVVKEIALILSTLLHTLFNFHCWNITTNAKHCNGQVHCQSKKQANSKTSQGKVTYTQIPQRENIYFIEHLICQSKSYSGSWSIGHQRERNISWKWNIVLLLHHLSLMVISTLNESHLSQLKDSLPQETNCLSCTPTTCNGSPTAPLSHSSSNFPLSSGFEFPANLITVSNEKILKIWMMKPIYVVH